MAIEDYGPIADFLASDDVTEVMVNSTKRIFIEKRGTLTKTNESFPSDAELMRVVRQLVTLAGKAVNPQVPLMDIQLSDGSRMTVTMPPVTPVPAFTIRRPTFQVKDINQLIKTDSLSAPMADFLRLAVQLRANILVSGGTSCGKTTLLNALAGGISLNHRIVSIEDTYEIDLPHENWIQLQTVFHDRGEQLIDMSDLVAHALHLRPDRILVGEVRGGEALNLLQAMNSGHDGCMATIHASSSADVISRLETLVLMAGFQIPLAAIRQQISRAIQLIVQMKRTIDGRRQIMAISEVTGIEDELVITKDIFVIGRDPVTGKQRFMATGHVPAFIQEAAANGQHLPANLFGN